MDTFLYIVAGTFITAAAIAYAVWEHFNSFTAPVASTSTAAAAADVANAAAAAAPAKPAQTSSAGARERRRLVVLDMNGVLLHREFKFGLDEPGKDPRIKTLLNSATTLGKFYVWDRPAMRDFVKYCLDRFDVAVWSSARQQNVDLLVQHVFGYRRKELVFEWDQTQCRIVSRPQEAVKEIEGTPHPIYARAQLPNDVTFQKPIAHIVREFRGRWGFRDIMMIDDSIAKMAPNPEESYVIAPAWTPLSTDPSVCEALFPDRVIVYTLDQFLRRVDNAE